MKRQAESDSLASKDVYDVVVYGGTSASSAVWRGNSTGA